MQTTKKKGLINFRQPAQNNFMLQSNEGAVLASYKASKNNTQQVSKLAMQQTSAGSSIVNSGTTKLHSSQNFSNNGGVPR